MSTRLDLALQKYQGHEDGIRLLASRDPSGNLKYLDWAARVVAAGQALAPEIADVLDLFHRFQGQRVDGGAGRLRRVRPHERVHPDIYTYRPQDFATLRDLLLKIKRAQDRKRKKRERLYRIEGAVEADVVHDSPDLIVRHVKNKQASVHYGLGTKWCISMLREGYFEDYEMHNATFFFFERKTPVGDDFDKVALMVPRGDGEDFVAFTAADNRVGLMHLARAYGQSIFGVFMQVLEASERYPGSALSCVYAGTATAEQIEAVFAAVVRGGDKIVASDAQYVLESICCNDAASPAILGEILARGAAILAAAWKRSVRTARRHRYRYNRKSHENVFARTVEAALVIHPAVTADVREQLVKRLRRRHVDISHVRRVNEWGDRVGIRIDRPARGPGGWLRRRRHMTPRALRVYADSLVRRAARVRKKVKTLERKLVEVKKRKLVAAKKAAAKKSRRP